MGKFSSNLSYLGGYGGRFTFVRITHRVRLQPWGNGIEMLICMDGTLVVIDHYIENFPPPSNQEVSTSYYVPFCLALRIS
jgi:hypothetical protein